MSQRHDALKIANRVRSAGAAVRQEVAVGLLSVAEALDDPRSEHLTIQRLLCSQRYYGPSRCGALLRPLHIWPTRRVRDLTRRQRQMIVQALER